VTQVTIVGSRDRQLEELLTSAGMSTKSIAVTSLAAVANGSDIHEVLVVDTRDGSGIPLSLGTLKRQRPALGVVIVVAALEPALMLDAMRAGVTELVADPLTRQDLESAIVRVAGQHQQSELGRTFGFVGAKGGVGTTTVAVNVAMALSRTDKDTRTLLVDMHQAGGDVAVLTGAEPKFSIVDALENTHRLDETYLRGLVCAIAPGLGLLASSDRTFATAADPDRIRAVIEHAARGHQYSVLDLPRSDAAVLDGLDRLSTLFVVVNQELAAVKSGARLVSTLTQRYGRDRIRVVLSRSDRHAEIGVADVERTIGAEIVHTFPSDYRAALQALNLGRPLALEGTNDLAVSFRTFAAQLTGRKQAERPSGSRVGLLGRLTQPKRA
jgi:pilus assembly protein CpaE